MATRKPLNAQLSSSWTWYPADPTTDNPYFEEFAAQGQNLFQAAGDSSKWTATGYGSEIFPADDVYVTTVGGTDLNTSSAAGPWSSETVWSDGGGGISPHNYAIPSWQTAAAAGCASCSKTYRNGPDVSANANFTFYVCADQTTCTANEYGGTSFATPMWAGYLALVNQQSATNGNKAVGFINPSPLYHRRGLQLRRRLSRHHQRQQRLFGHHRLRSGHRMGQPERERPDQRAGRFFLADSVVQPVLIAQFDLSCEGQQRNFVHHFSYRKWIRRGSHTKLIRRAFRRDRRLQSQSHCSSGFRIVDRYVHGEFERGRRHHSNHHHRLRRRIDGNNLGLADGDYSGNSRIHAVPVAHIENRHSGADRNHYRNHERLRWI